MSRTRLAPSPTGALHLGNARTFLVNWALARQRGWEVVLRIEDLDGPRIKTGATEEATDILAWLGLNWDEGPFTQRHDLIPYLEMLQQLSGQGAIYPCRCTRRQIEEASLSAPHGDAHELRYPGTCRPDRIEPVGDLPLGGDLAWSDTGAAWRLRVPDESIRFDDCLVGPQSHNVQRVVGDFLVATKRGTPSYQLACVVDDARQGIDQIVRGDDLVRSTPRQLLLYSQLKLGPVPAYTHLPLVVGEDGRRLAKRHGDSRITAYRQQGVQPERLLGLLAHWCGLGPRAEIKADEFLAHFDLENLPREPVVFRQEDDAWLRGQ